MKTSIGQFAAKASMISMAIIMVASAAQAQAAPATQAANAADETKEIVVTGSLIKRPNNTAVSPIVSLSTEAIKQSGQVTLESALNQLPGFTPSGSSATGGQGTGGHVTVNLHGLGSNRNLVLLDGKRLPLADITGDVDINFIPAAIVSNVEAITGGASAIYGSDAMSGVVNFKTSQLYDGVILDGQIGNSFKGDYRNIDLAGSYGTKFAQGRGHFMIGASYANRQGLSGADRPDFFGLRVPSSFIGQGTFVPSANNLPSQAAVNAVFAQYGVAAGVVPNAINLGFNNDGSLFTQNGSQTIPVSSSPINYKGPTTGYWSTLGGNVRMPVGLQTQLLNPLERKTVFAKFDYELSSSVKAYGQFMYVNSLVNTASGNSLTQLNTLTTIPVTNPFIPADLATLLASRQVNPLNPTKTGPTQNFLWNARYVGLPYKSWDEKYDVFQILGGLKGDLPLAGWKFDAYIGYDETKHDQQMNNAVLKSQVQNLLNAVDGGNSLCAGGFNPFGLANATNISSACKAYLTATEHNRETLTQLQTALQVDGKLFHLQGGDAHVALVANYRRNTYVFTPSSDLRTGNIEAVIASAAVPSAAIGVKEFAAQVDFPLIKDKPLIKEFGIGGAIRYSDYTTSGGTTSYEGDLRWKPVNQLLFRGSYQRAVRAPNIGELFSPVTGQQLILGDVTKGSIGDPCDVRSSARTGANGAQVATLCQAQGVPANIIGSYQFPTTATGALLQGNKGLTPEKATTYNFGAVLSPHSNAAFLREFSVSVDYYNINIKNVISPIDGLTALSKCFNLDGSNPSYSNSFAYCQYVSRDANGQLVSVATPYLNLGGLKTDGIEIQVNWGMRLADLGFHNAGGKIYLNSNIGYLNSFQRQALAGSAFQEFAGTNTVGTVSSGGSFPHWKALTTLGYRSEGLGFGLRWHYQGAMKDVSSVLTPSKVSAGVGEYDLFDLFSTLKVNKQFEMRAGINNLFNKQPPVVTSAQNGADPAVFDFIGRQFYVGVKVKF